MPACTATSASMTRGSSASPWKGWDCRESAASPASLTLHRSAVVTNQVKGQQMTYILHKLLLLPHRGPPFVVKFGTLGGARSGPPYGVPWPQTTPGQRLERSLGFPPNAQWVWKRPRTSLTLTLLKSSNEHVFFWRLKKQLTRGSSLSCRQKSPPQGL